MAYLTSHTSLCIVVSVVLTLFNAASTAEYCAAYCNANGNHRGGFSCPDLCCGNSTYRTCCDNESLRVPDSINTDVCFCTYSSCIYYNWQALMGVSVIVFVVLVVAICCCQCCGECSQCRESATPCCPPCFTRSQVGSVSSVSADMPQPTMSVNDDPIEDRSGFSPLHPFAFGPPDYDSLPKDPPKYEELMLSRDGLSHNGYTNMAYHCDGTQTPPPAFTECVDYDMQPRTSSVNEDNTPSTSSGSRLDYVTPSTSRGSCLDDVTPSTSRGSRLDDVTPSTSRGSRLDDVTPSISRFDDVTDVLQTQTRLLDSRVTRDELQEVVVVSRSTRTTHNEDESESLTPVEHTTNCVQL